MVSFGSQFGVRVHEGGERVAMGAFVALHTLSESRTRWMLVSALFSSSTQSRTPIHGIVPPTTKMCFPSSGKHYHRHMLRCFSM